MKPICFVNFSFLACSNTGREASSGNEVTSEDGCSPQKEALKIPIVIKTDYFFKKKKKHLMDLALASVPPSCPQIKKGKIIIKKKKDTGTARLFFMTDFIA